MSDPTQSVSTLSPKVQWAVWGFLAAVVISIAALFVASKSGRTRESGFPVLSEVKDFSLTNQLDEPVRLSKLDGQVWVGNIIFTQCAGPCPRLTKLMGTIQQDLKGVAGVRLVTLTTDPDHDTPKVLRKYSEKFGADPNRWWFLTGTKKEIAGLARDSLKLTAIEKSPGERDTDVDLFIHSTIFVVVDKHGRMRATFETDEPDSKEKILDTVKRLLIEN
jgi:protein SCO1/2